MILLAWFFKTVLPSFYLVTFFRTFPFNKFLDFTHIETVDRVWLTDWVYVQALNKTIIVFLVTLFTTFPLISFKILLRLRLLIAYDWLTEYTGFEYNYFWNYIAVSLDVGIVEVFVFHAIWVQLLPYFNTTLFSGKEVPPPPPQVQKYLYAYGTKYLYVVSVMPL